MELSAEQEAAFKGIVQRYYERILKFCVYSLGGRRSAAEDCTQDIFLILYEKMPLLKDYDKIGGWLYKTADNISKRCAASLRKNRERFAAPFPVFGTEESPLDTIAAQNSVKTEEDRLAEEKTLERATAEIRKRLSPKDEQMLRLAFREKHPLKEIAARLGISLSAAKSRASRLRQKIKVLTRELLAD